MFKHAAKYINKGLLFYFIGVDKAHLNNHMKRNQEERYQIKEYNKKSF